MSRSLQALSILLFSLCGLTSCKTTQTAAHWSMTSVASMPGFSVPECMVVDPASGHIYVSNINADKEHYWSDLGNGFISKLAPDGSLIDLKWLKSADKSAVHAPKGMCIMGKNLYYTDNTRLMKVALSGAARPETIPIAGAQKLNDLATDGSHVWVSDTGAGTIHKVNNAGKAQLWARVDSVNGVTCHKGKTYAVSWGLHEIFELSSTANKPPKAFNLASHFTALDGIEVLEDGCFIVSDFMGNKVCRVTADRKQVSTLATIESPADIGLNRDTGHLYVPSFMSNSTSTFKLHPPSQTMQSVEVAQ